MAAKLAVGVDARSRLRRLAAIFAVELRMKIVVELYMREMSAKQFYEEFGGGSPTRINQNFVALEKKGWLRLLYREGPGGRRRGGVEHFYRATELPFMDAESWSLLPYSVRLASSWNMFTQIVPRLRLDIERSHGTDGYRRDLTRTELSMDEQGWANAIAAVDAEFVSLYEEQEDSRRRSLVSGEALTRADVFLVAFQSSPLELPLAESRLLVESRREPLVRFPERLAPILKDDLQLEIISELNRKELSVTQFHREFGGTSKPGVSRRFKGLESAGWTARGSRRTGGSRRGATEQFYRATKPAIEGFEMGGDPPGSLRSSGAWGAFEGLSSTLQAAIGSGAFDAKADRHFAWSLIRLDQRGWEHAIAGLEALARFLAEEEKRAERRLAKSGEQPITMTLGLAAYEAPAELAKAP